MFRKTRIRIIVSIMGSLLLLFTVTLSVIMLASSREIRQRNTEMLERYVELYHLEGEAGLPPVPPPDDAEGPAGKPPQGRPPLDQEAGYQLSTFYSVAFGEDGSVLDISDGGKEVYSGEELSGIAEAILSEGRSSGRWENLTYIVSPGPGFTLVAFMDNTVSESSLSTLLRNMLMMGGAALILLFFFSLFLSGRIVRPLEENDRRQRQFISDASHELKTPAAVISANAEILGREIGENEWLANIMYENERMGGLVTQLLDLSRAENAQVPMESLDFSRIAAGEALAFESLAFDRGREIQSHIREGIQVTGNRTQLAQLVSVLLDNAVRHSTGREIEVSLKTQGHAAILTVVNDGGEISREQAEHLFDRFYRLDEARSSEGQHYGLGLSIARAITEKHGGSIGVTSHEGKVRFTVTLPVRKS